MPSSRYNGRASGGIPQKGNDRQSGSQERQPCGDDVELFIGGSNPDEGAGFLPILILFWFRPIAPLSP